MMRKGELGYWHRSLGGPPAPRAPLPGSITADVAIVGAGFTGLWTAYYLKRSDPSLNIVVLESEFAGYGASGRNGGWVMGLCDGAPEDYARRGGREAVLSLRIEMIATVDEIGEALEREGIEADFLKGGGLTVAIGDAQEQRLRAVVQHERSWDPSDSDTQLLSEDELRTRLNVAGARVASFTPNIARVHPAKLVRGLAEAVERLGVPIYESTPVGEIQPHRAVSERGTVTADWIVRATEAYTSSLSGLTRSLVPVNSSMIITEPLPREAWDEIGWQGYETLGDQANLYVYLQRTADGRIAIGGRGVPYRYGSQTDFGGEIADVTVKALQQKVYEMFPSAAGTPIAHGWSGVIGVPRDWCVSVNADPDTGLAWAGGYSGEGVAATNLGARILCDLILGSETGLTRLPWVGHQPSRWEPEPLRFAAIRSIYALYGIADRIEARTRRVSAIARIADSISGR